MINLMIYILIKKKYYGKSMKQQDLIGRIIDIYFLYLDIGKIIKY